MKKKVFIESVNMETQTVFHEDGNINIYPCDFELGQQIVANTDGRASQKGRMVTEDDGTSHFHPYAKDSGSRYKKLWVEPYGVLKMSKTRLVLNVSVPLTISDPIGWLESDANACLPSNTDRNVMKLIRNAINSIKKQRR